MRLTLSQVIGMGDIDPGQLVLFYERDATPGRRWIVDCKENESVELPDVQLRLRVCWYPYVKSEGRRVQIWGGHGVITPNRKSGVAAVYLSEPCHPTDGIPSHMRKYTLMWHTHNTHQRSLGPVRTEFPALASYIQRSRQAVHGLDPPTGAPRWSGSYFDTYVGALPMSAFVHRAWTSPPVSAPTLEHWLRVACFRLRIGDNDYVSLDQKAELLGEMATLRALSMVYRVDATLDERPVDTWTPLTDFPDPSHASYDCEDGAFDALCVLSSIERYQGDSELLCELRTLMRSYLFCMALGSLRSDSGQYIWHAYVIGLDANSVQALFHNPAAGDTRVPPLLIETTEYTTSNWSLDAVVPEGVTAIDRLLVNRTGLVGYKATAQAVQSSGQYGQTALLFVPPSWYDAVGGPEVVLTGNGQHGVDTAKFLQQPTAGVHWKVVPGGLDESILSEQNEALSCLPPLTTPTLSDGMEWKDECSDAAPNCVYAWTRPVDRELMPHTDARVTHMVVHDNLGLLEYAQLLTPEERARVHVGEHVRKPRRPVTSGRIHARVALRERKAKSTRAAQARQRAGQYDDRAQSQ